MAPSEDAFHEKGLGRHMCVAIVNGVIGEAHERGAPGARTAPLLSVTLSGSVEAADAWVEKHPEAKRLRPPHHGVWAADL